MSAYFESGFCVRKPSWHAEENLLLKAPKTYELARTAASMEWDVEMVPNYRIVTLHGGAVLTKDMYPVRADDAVELAVTESFYDGTDMLTVVRNGCTLDVFAPCDKSASIVRNDTHAELGNVSPSYSPLYIAQMGQIAEALAGQGATYETMGSVNSGAQVYVLMRLDEGREVAGDDTLTIPFFSILNDFTGGGAAKLIFTGVRVVCWNTYQMASFAAEQSGHQYVWRHTGDMQGNVDAAVEALSGLRSSFHAWVDMAEELNKVGIDEDQVHTFSSLFIPEPAEGAVFTDRQRANVARDRAAFVRLYNESPTTDAHRGTALGLLDASVEFVDHVRKAANQDVLLTRTMLKPNPAKRASLALIHEVTGAKVPDAVKFN